MSRRHLALILAVAGLAPAAFAQPQAPPPTANSAAPEFYFSRAVTDADLKGRTLRELSLLRNTIFARTGRIYHNAWLNTYFRAQAWYKPTAKPNAALISKLDWTNATQISQAEANQDKATLLARAKGLETKQTAGTITTAGKVELRLISARIGRWVGAADQLPSDRSPFEDPSLLDSQLTKTQLHDMSRRKLRLLRNMIFARKGYAFKSDLLRDYFSDTDWYKIDLKCTAKKLSRQDWRNVKFIKSIEHSMGGPMTDWEHMEEEGWFAAA